MKRKMGIMTMQRIANYGSFLQAYALKELLTEQGAEAEFVDYHVEPTVFADKNDKETHGWLRAVRKGFATMSGDAPVMQKFAYIRHKRQFAGRYLGLLGVGPAGNYNPVLDCLVIGSDEVFNCIQDNSRVGYSPELFGRGHRAARLVSYAASFGNTTLEKLERWGKAEEIGKLLTRFDRISVRDRNSGEIVRSLTGREPLYHMDPVLIYDFAEREERIPEVEIRERYLILYAYSGRIAREESDWIASYARRKGLKIYTIGGVHPCGNRFLDCSPFETLAWFRGAEEVITDTFHGTIFSVVFHRPFAVLVRKSIGDGYGNEEKLTDLLNRLGLMQRAVRSVEEIERINSEPVDYPAVESILGIQRQETLDYLYGIMQMQM